MPARDDARTIRVPYNVTLYSSSTVCGAVASGGPLAPEYIYIYIFIVATIRSAPRTGGPRSPHGAFRVSSVSKDLEPSSRYLSQRGRGGYSFWIHTLSPPPDFELSVKPDELFMELFDCTPRAARRQPPSVLALAPEHPSVRGSVRRAREASSRTQTQSRDAGN